MTLRPKIILIVLPLIIVSVVLAGMSSYLVATTGITRIATEFLAFKASELEKYAESQWNLLVENGVADRADMRQAAEAGVGTFARSIVRSRTELILAVDKKGSVLMSTSPVTPSASERRDLATLAMMRLPGLRTVTVGGVGRTATGFTFGPFGWYVLVTEERATFYQDVDRITRQTAIILGGACLAAVLLLLLFASYLTRPIEKVVDAMKGIIGSSDLTARVEVEYNDEIGHLAQTFNVMIGELEKAYNQIKKYAFEAVLAQKKEARIRRIFQKYVPQELIDRFFLHPESMLVGENRELAVLFSDIRGFTTISESMPPDELVMSLNRYFGSMVDIIMRRNGIIDKYIGDAIMAFFGAPVHHDDDALQSVNAALDMADALDAFNGEQERAGKPRFNIGVGINYGEVTVGNIGCEKKMDYTVIGDMVNLASRLEGLTKMYHQQLIFSEFVQEKVKDSLQTRLLDSVQVKGKTRGVRIYTARRSLSDREHEAWTIHNQAMALYYGRRFAEAAVLLARVSAILPDDTVAVQLRKRCLAYELNPPPADWDGVEVMTSK